MNYASPALFRFGLICGEQVGMAPGERFLRRQYPAMGIGRTQERIAQQVLAVVRDQHIRQTLLCSRYDTGIVTITCTFSEPLHNLLTGRQRGREVTAVKQASEAFHLFI